MHRTSCNRQQIPIQALRAVAVGQTHHFFVIALRVFLGQTRVHARLQFLLRHDHVSA
jgi:hypothetical protein